MALWLGTTFQHPACTFLTTAVPARVMVVMATGNSDSSQVRRARSRVAVSAARENRPGSKPSRAKLFTRRIAEKTLLSYLQ